jgi:spore coat protein CotH
MSRRSWVVIVALLYGCVAMGWGLPEPAARPAEKGGKEEPAKAKQKAKDAGTKKAEKEAPAQDVFGLSKVHQLHLELTAEEWEKMQKVTGGMRFPGGPGFGGPGGGPFGPGGPGGPGRPPAAADDKPADDATERHKGGGFGMEFPWAHGQLTEDGTTYKEIAIRYKGNASYMASARNLKRNLKVELDRYDSDQRYHGLKSINFNAGAMDPTRMREALGFAVFRAAGVPAPRTAFAEVTLTVPGKYDKEYLGVYTLIEQVDRTFLKDRFKNNKGVLMKPERGRGMDYLGDDWNRYKAQYQPKHEPSKEEAQRVIGFARLIHKADDEQFARQIGSYLDVDEFLRFVAVNALLVNFDSFLSLGHNFFLYLNPDTNKFLYIPWDLDLSFGGFPMMGGTPAQQQDLSLMHPHMGENRLIDRLLAIKEVREKYQKVLKELSDGCFSRERLRKDLDTIEKAMKEPLAKEKKAVEARREGGGFGFGPPPGMFGGQTTSLKEFIEKRSEAVAAQVAGKSKGWIPQLGFGPFGPGRFGGPSQQGQILPGPLQEALKLTPDQRKQVEELQKEIEGKLDKLLTAEQRKQLKEMRDNAGRPPGGFGPPGFGPPGFAPPGFGPPGGLRPGGPGDPGRPPGDRRDAPKKEEKNP